MTYTQIVTDDVSLKTIVQGYWFVEGADQELTKVIPDGFPELIFHFGDPYQVRLENGLSNQPLCIAAGQLTRPLYLKPTGESKVFGIKFKPAAIWRLFGCDMKSLQNATEPMENVIDDTGRLYEKLRTISAPAEQIKFIEEFLTSRLLSARQTDIDDILRHVEARSGEISVEELCDRFSVSPRKIERMFNDQIGISLKMYARLVRFKKVFGLLQKNRLTKTEVTYLCGYFDQAHFNKEFKMFSGEHPSAYFKQNHAFANFFMQ